MITLVFRVLFFSFALMSQFSFGQANHIAKLEKNKSLGARTLIHELNKTKDTLILQSPSKIGRIYSISDSIEREIDIQPNAFNYKLPLQNLSKGKHVLVVSQSPKKIIFVVYISDKITTI